MQRIDAALDINAPAERVFDLVSDHERFIHASDTRTQVIRAGTPDKNGLGCLREVHATMGMRFVEEVTAWVRPSSYEYLIRESSLPIRHLNGRVTVTPNGSGTHVVWSSSFEIPVPVIGPLIAMTVRSIGTRAFMRFLVAAKKLLEQ